MALLRNKISYNAILPWLVLLVFGVYVIALSAYSSRGASPRPQIDFYSLANVLVEVEGENVTDSSLFVLGQYLNIVIGDKVTKKGNYLSGNKWEIPFQINSPRPASLFFNDAKLDIFIFPDSILKINLWLDTENEMIDSLKFSGYTSGICDYYIGKEKRMGRLHLRSYRHTIRGKDMASLAANLDSLSTRELAWLLEQATANQLPHWFIDFEKSEILFQKAHLKLANLSSDTLDMKYLDDIPIQDNGAAYSLYYYTYLRTWFDQKLSIKTRKNEELRIKKQLGLADKLLEGEARNIFMAATIYDAIKQGKKELAEPLLSKYESSFSHKKYVFFLRKKLQ